MRSLIATALSCAYADETSLMQARLQTSSQQLSTSKARQVSSSKLLDSAVQLIKNGATPDVQEFIGATTTEIDGDDGIKSEIQAEHDADQRYVDTLMGRFQTAVDTLADSLTVVGVHQTGCEDSGRVHHQCRAEEAFACARSRRCEEQLRTLWVHVKTAEEDLREKHSEIHGERCVELPTCSIDLCLGRPNQLPEEPYPNPLPQEPHCLTHCMDWSRTSSYPLLDYAHGVVELRDWSVTHFEQYKVKKEVVERAWEAYNLKLSTCSDLEADLDAKSPVCDEAQHDMHRQCCMYSEQNMNARETFGQEWDSLMRSYTQAKMAKDLDQMDRIAEWETLTIVECLLRHVYDSVEENLDSGAPCPTIDSDPEGVTRAIEDCHIVTRGCVFAWNHTFDRRMFADDGTEIPMDRGTGESNTGVAFHEDSLIHTGPICDPNRDPRCEGTLATGTWPVNADSLTAHLCLDWGMIPDPCPGRDDCMPDQFDVCDAAHVAKEQGSFLSDIQTDYLTALNAADDHANDPLNSHLTVLSAAGWAGCAAPLICEQCEGASKLSVDTSRTEASTECHLHEEYLVLGANDARTFRCLDGTCLPMSGRCNGVDQCGDGSDEQGCDAPYVDNVELQTGAAYLAVSDVCPVNYNSDVFFPCGDGRCIEKLGLCNGIDNCGNGVDEAACSGDISISLEATSGRTITVEHLQTSTGVFHDRQYYQFQSLGDFAGKTFIKYSNDDKLTDHNHVMIKIRTVEPMTVFIVAHDQLPWMGQSWTEQAMTGVTFTGQREIVRGDVATEWQDTRHKEWDPSLNTEDDFSFGRVFSKTFAAGTIAIQGNTVVDGDRSDGSFLIFVERPSETPTHVVMVDGCENQNTEVSREVVHISDARTASVRCCNDVGDHCDTSDLQGGCQSDKTYEEAVQVCADNSMRLCTESEITNRVCCGTGCNFDGHQIWVAGESD